MSHVARSAKQTGFRQLDISLALSVKPYYLRNLDEGVNAEMSKHLLKFVPEFDGCQSLLPLVLFEGVLVAWWDIRFSDPSKSGALLWEFPDVHIRIGIRMNQLPSSLQLCESSYSHRNLE